MGQAQPYYRICRPFTNGCYLQNVESTYLRDPRYAADRSHLIRAYYLLEKDLLRAFDFIEPADSNLMVHSHELYEILLRACTEVETNAKAILRANNYTKQSNFNITDFFKLERACRLSEYRVTLPVWSGKQYSWQPFLNWQNSHTLEWYQDYNSVKHDRFVNFEHANLKNVLNAVTAVFILLFAQFHVLAFHPFHVVTNYYLPDNGRLSHERCFLQIELPNSWSDDENYEFDWNFLISQVCPFQIFSF